ncbi:MAG: protease complex subunit PrcB family protein, partial [Bacilli bacterium]|nr:protease complex subunit PrcB family protein [Bacilli bacterium]
SNNSNGSNNNLLNNSGCKYGIKDYSGYIPAYLISGNCAVEKSEYYNSVYSNQASTIGAIEYKKLVSEIDGLKTKTGANVYVEAPVYTAVYNKANTGFVGYQIKFAVKLKQSNSSKSIYEYYLNTDGSRKVILDNRSSVSSNTNMNYKILDSYQFDANYIKRGYYIKQLEDGKVRVTVAMGEKNTGGYSISILKVNIIDKGVQIYVEETSPAKEDVVIAAFTYPVAQVEFNMMPEYIMVQNSDNFLEFEKIENN